MRPIVPGRIFIGTSGWSYSHWTGSFYPQGLPAKRRLAFYATRYPTVEVNATFYRLPSEDVVRAWRDQVPPEFRFAVKGSRYITHVRSLADVQRPVHRFLSRVGLLGDRLAVALWQLPPSLAVDTALLDAFLAVLPSVPRHAVEFRHPSWVCEESFAVLRRHNVAHVHVSSDSMPTDFSTTADFVYVRLHGLAAEHGAYTAHSLLPWARFVADQQAAGRDCYVFFNNDAGGHAPRDAARLRAMLASAASESAEAG